jgi:CBS-domain-containing membrane protein
MSTARNAAQEQWNCVRDRRCVTRDRGASLNRLSGEWLTLGGRRAEPTPMATDIYNAIFRIRTLRVSDVMNRTVTEVNARQAMSEVAHVFIEHEISAAPVVDDEGFCVGVLTATDFLKRDSSAATDTQPPLSHVADCARSFMSPAVQTIAADEPLLTAAKIMCAQHVHRLFVIDSLGHPVGVISTMDLVAMLVHVFDEMQH